MSPYTCRAVLSVGILVACLLPAGKVRAYSLQGGTWRDPNDPFGSPVTVTYSYNNLLDGVLLQPDDQPLPVDLIRRSIEEALGLWASVAPLHFVEVEDQGGPVYFGTPYSDGQFGQIRFNARNIDGQEPEIGRPKAKAQAYYPTGPGNLAGDVFFDYSDRWQSVGTLSQPDVLGAAVHELGHSLGLAHTSAQQPDAYWHWLEYNEFGEVVEVTEPKGAAVMYWIFERFAGPGTGYLFADDIAGIRAIYGTGVGSVTPLAVPEPASWVLVTLVAFGWRIFARRGRAARNHAD